MKREIKGTCAFCGRVTLVTDDHVPPRNIFPTPQPNDVELITVPSCSECNHRSARDDEEFKVYITLKSGMDGEAPLMLHESTKRTVRKNRRIRRQIIENSTPLFLPGDRPNTFQKQIIYKFNPAPIRRVGRKIIKGLYFKHFGESLEGKAEVSLCLSDDFKPYQMLTIENLAKETWRFGSHHVIGKNR